jgi:hypothetical protein
MLELKEFTMPPEIYVIDSREKNPYVFEDCKTITVALEEGDYGVLSSSGTLLPVRVERKTLADLQQSLGQERFMRELSRLHSVKSYLLIEATATQVIEALDAHSKFALMEQCTEFAVQPIFGDDREISQYLCRLILRSELFAHEMSKWLLTKIPEYNEHIKIGPWGGWVKYDSNGDAVASGNTIDSLHNLIRALPTAKPPQAMNFKKTVFPES